MKFGLYRSVGTVAVESVVVGLIFAVLYAVVVAAQNQFTKEDVPMAQGVVASFIAGVLGHWTFELTGLNEGYCQYAGKQWSSQADQ